MASGERITTSKPRNSYGRMPSTPPFSLLQFAFLILQSPRPIRQARLLTTVIASKSSTVDHSCLTKPLRRRFLIHADTTVRSLPRANGDDRFSSRASQLAWRPTKIQICLTNPLVLIFDFASDTTTTVCHVRPSSVAVLPLSAAIHRSTHVEFGDGLHWQWFGHLARFFISCPTQPPLLLPTLRSKTKNRPHASTAAKRSTVWPVVPSTNKLFGIHYPIPAALVQTTFFCFRPISSLMKCGGAYWRQSHTVPNNPSAARRRRDVWPGESVATWLAGSKPKPSRLSRPSPQRGGSLPIRADASLAP